MGFFQSLKDDLSVAMNELMNDELDNNEIIDDDSSAEIYPDNNEDEGEAIYDEEISLDEEFLKEDFSSEEGLEEEYSEGEISEEEYYDEQPDEDYMALLDSIAPAPKEPRSARSAINSLKAAGKRFEQKKLQEAIENGAVGSIITDDGATIPVPEDPDYPSDEELAEVEDTSDIDVAAMLDKLDLDALVKESEALEADSNAVNLDDIISDKDLKHDIALATEVKEEIKEEVKEEINEPALNLVDSTNDNQMLGQMNIEDLLSADLSTEDISNEESLNLEEVSGNDAGLASDELSITDVPEENIEKEEMSDIDLSAVEATDSVDDIQEMLNEELSIDENTTDLLGELLKEEPVVVENPINEADNLEASIADLDIDGLLNEVIEEVIEEENATDIIAESLPVDAPIQEAESVSEDIVSEKPVDKEMALEHAKAAVMAKETSTELAVEENVKENVKERAYMPDVPLYVPEIPKEFSDETAIITKGMRVVGDVASNGNLDVNGTVVGNISIIGKLSVSGTVVGKSTAHEIFADGAEINGDINVTGTVKVGQSTVIIGNISSTSAVIAGAVKGDIDVQGPVVLDSTAIVMGDIKSMSVQINNGAVIEGLCSQCYASVNPSSFFDDFKKNTALLTKK